MAAVVAALAGGCACMRQNDGGDACRRPGIASEVVHGKFSVAKDEVSARDSLNCLFGIVAWGSTATHFADDACDESSLLTLDFAAAAKNGAYANACDAANCDRIVGAKYTVKVDDYLVFKRITAEVTGYPVTFVGVEPTGNRAPCCAK